METNVSTEQRYHQFLELLAEIAALQNLGALLGWDQQVWLPQAAHGERGEQASLVSQLAHARFTSAMMEDLLGALTEASEELSADAVVNVRETKRTFDREKRLSPKLVAEMSEAFSRGYEAWLTAKQDADFDRFAPCLKRNVELQREAAQCYGFECEPYDALLEGNERGMTAVLLEKIFGGLKSTIVQLLRDIRESIRSAEPFALKAIYPVDRQQALSAALAARMGFDFRSGRLDSAPHPFTTQLGSHDVRLTSWYREQDPFVAIRAALHETGHGLYRQGFDASHRGTPLASIASKGIDESQARFWENCVGRSRDFWEFFFPEFTKAFPGRDADVGIDHIVRRMHMVAPGASRVHADEVTYNLHIILRFDIERDLMRGRITVDELPAFWNERMAEDLGVVPADDAEGVLQDPHWSDGMFGYFPTYALGNVYASQFHEAMQRELPDFSKLVRRGEFLPIREWLREKVHRHGMRYSPADLIQQATGRAPSSDAFIQYLRQKYGNG